MQVGSCQQLHANTAHNATGYWRKKSSAKQRELPTISTHISGITLTTNSTTPLISLADFVVVGVSDNLYNSAVQTATINTNLNATANALTMSFSWNGMI